MTATCDARRKPSTAIGLRYAVNVVVIVVDIVPHFAIIADVDGYV